MDRVAECQEQLGRLWMGAGRYGAPDKMPALPDRCNRELVGRSVPVMSAKTALLGFGGSRQRTTSAAMIEHYSVAMLFKYSFRYARHKWLVPVIGQS